MAGQDLDEMYPQSCPFCTIARAYPSPPTAPTSSTELSSSPSYPSSSIPQSDSLLQYVPSTVDVEKTSPSCFLVLSSPHVVAFLDILPMTRGHLLVCVRGHREKIEHVDGTEGRELGFWLPILAKAVKTVTGVGDYNIVQNNGMFYPSQFQIFLHIYILLQTFDFSSFSFFMFVNWIMR
jgi:hypothetical protein